MINNLWEWINGLFKTAKEAKRHEGSQGTQFLAEFEAAPQGFSRGAT